MKKKYLGLVLFLMYICNVQYIEAQELLTNVYGRQYTFLNGNGMRLLILISKVGKLPSIETGH